MTVERRYLACITSSGKTARGGRVHLLRPDGKCAVCEPWLYGGQISERGWYQVFDSLDAVPPRASGSRADLCGRCEAQIDRPTPAPKASTRREAAERERLAAYVRGE